MEADFAAVDGALLTYWQAPSDDLLPDAYRARLRGIEYFTALCLLIELDRRFSPFYWTNIGDDTLPFVGLIEHTNLMGAERYGGRRSHVANYRRAARRWVWTLTVLERHARRGPSTPP
jgi:hypothetical protein